MTIIKKWMESFEVLIKCDELVVACLYTAV
jgi:hypothetical protein